MSSAEGHEPGNAARCSRCGGGHTARQRCPFDPVPAADATFDDRLSDALRRRGVGITHDAYDPSEESPLGQAPLPRSAPSAYQPASLAPRYTFSTYRPRQRWPQRPAGGARNPIVQWTAAIVCSVVIVACVSVCGVYIARLPEVEHRVVDSLVVVFIAAGIGVAAGVVPLYYLARAFAGVAYAALSLTLITGGAVMLAIAPIVRQMNVRHVAEYTGFWALIWFGVVATVLGLGLGALCARWALSRDARRRVAGWARLLMTSYGVLLGLSGIVTMLALFALVNADSNEFEAEPSVVELALLFTSVGMFSLVPGLILTYHGISESMGEGSGEARVPVAAIAAAAFGVVMVLGHLNMRRESPTALPMPALHVLASLLPGLAYVALAARGSLLRGAPARGVTWRQLTLSAGLAMSLATSIALYVEGLGSYIAILLLLVHNGVFAFAENAAEVNTIIGNADLILTENEQFVAGLIVGALLAPVAEEFGKSLSVRFLMRPTSTRAQCFLLGAAAGAAFGFLEAMFYGVSVISENLDDWWQIMLIRGGSSSLHVICSGMAGVGWWYWSVGRRHRQAIALFIGAMLIHGAWNAFATILDSRILVLDTLSNRTLEIVAYGIIAVASAAMIVAVPVVARWLRDAPPAPVEGTPLAGMQAWLG